MVTENDIFGVCIIVQHPTDETLILGISRKDNHSDFGLPGGKVDLITTPGGYEYKEWPRRTGERELQEETGVTLRDAGAVSSLKNIHTGTDSHSHVVRCYLAINAVTKTLQQQEGEGIVKWCTWEELEAGCFGEFNKKVHQKLDRIFEKEGNPLHNNLIGVEVTRMAEASFKVHFDDNGSMTSYGTDGTQPYVFAAKLHLDDYYTTRSTTRYELLDKEKNISYYMSTKELFIMLKSTTVVNGVIDGIWSFRKGQKVSLHFFQNRPEEK